MAPRDGGLKEEGTKEDRNQGGGSQGGEDSTGRRASDYTQDPRVRKICWVLLSTGAPFT